MADVVNAWKVDLGDRVQDLSASTQVGKVPTPVVVRAEQLCDLLDAAGEAKPDRQFLVAALIATTDDDIEALVARLREYRLAHVHEVVLGTTATEGTVTLPKPRG